MSEVLTHPWLQDLDPQAFLEKKVEPPFKPTLSSNILDVSNFAEDCTKEEVHLSKCGAEEIEQIKDIGEVFNCF